MKELKTNIIDGMLNYQISGKLEEKDLLVNEFINKDTLMPMIQLSMQPICKEQLDDIMKYSTKEYARQVIIDSYMEYIDLFLKTKLGL